MYTTNLLLYFRKSLFFFFYRVSCPYTNNAIASPFFFFCSRLGNFIQSSLGVVPKCLWVFGNAMNSKLFSQVFPKSLRLWNCSKSKHIYRRYLMRIYTNLKFPTWFASGLYSALSKYTQARLFDVGIWNYEYTLAKIFLKYNYFSDLDGK